ncbi:MAG: methyltransferase domain-containing protein [Paludibacteraceae bacterium]|nr:methyltransferase domain-containing protein [Paludibacteraceae bacterium]
MKLSSPQAEIYGNDSMSALEAQRFAQFIAWSPVVFQVSYVMVKWGIFTLLSEHKEGLTIDEVAEQKGISHYAAQILLEGSLVIGTVYLNKEGKFCIAKTGRFFTRDGMALRDLNFNQDVNYLGLFSLEDALKNGKPEGLKVFGSWPTIYEALSSLPQQVQKSWFGYDHYYSDNSFPEALKLVFSRPTRSLLDVGGNTGRFAVQCIDYNADVKVTIMDLPQQLDLMRQATNCHPSSERIGGFPANLLDDSQAFPTGFDAIWMSQFLDCFSEEQVISILTRAAKSMSADSRLYIMETLWDRQRFETASFSLAMASVYFTAMANGNSKMFYSEDLIRMVRQAGLELDVIHDGLGLGHSLLVCKKA